MARQPPSPLSTARRIRARRALDAREADDLTDAALDLAPAAWLANLPHRRAPPASLALAAWLSDLPHR